MNEQPQRFPLLLPFVRRRSAGPHEDKRMRSIPWGLIEPHRLQAERNHWQSLERLAERGGLAPSEALAVLEDRPWKAMGDGDEALERLAALVDAYERDSGGAS